MHFYFCRSCLDSKRSNKDFSFDISRYPIAFPHNFWLDFFIKVPGLSSQRISALKTSQKEIMSTSQCCFSTKLALRITRKYLNGDYSVQFFRAAKSAQNNAASALIFSEGALFQRRAALIFLKQL